ncbi:MAG TPA: lytic transglycosylase domain-containing protein [Candidatus Nanoarchaeia archaeon]|nr:lytic transglycosylase domain-containing protein [Candidatus Nanoarchaeia archaeon]
MNLEDDVAVLYEKGKKRKINRRSFKRELSDFREHPLQYLDSKQYKINKRVGPLMYGALTAAGGIAAFGYLEDKLLSVGENVPALGTPSGKIMASALGAALIYEVGKDVLFGKKNSKLPLLKKLNYPGLWNTSKQKNEEMYRKDRRHKVSRGRKNLGYAKNFGLAALLGGAILSGAAKNTTDNLRFNLSEILSSNKETVELTKNQNKTIDHVLAKPEAKFDLGKATDSEIKKSMIEAELYRMTDTYWERKKAWLTKNRIKDYEPIIKREAELHGITPALIEGIIFAESHGNRYAKSSKGAMGLMQLTKEIVKRYGVTNPYDPEESIKGGVRLLKDLVDECNGNIPEALSLYNCRPDAIQWAKKKSGSNDPFVFSHWLKDEAREYPVKVMAAMSYMVNGTAPEEPEAVASSLSPNQNMGSEFKFLRKRNDGDYVFSYAVKKGDTPIGIARKFNATDASNGDNYRDVSFKTGVVNSKGYFVGNTINPGQEIYVVAGKY